MGSSLEDFVREFDQWAPTYDFSVFERPNETDEVFEGYEEVLAAVVDAAAETSAGRTGAVNADPDDMMVDDIVVDVGMGTGNLTELLLRRGYRVIGIDPSPQMRQYAGRKLSSVPILPGHFLALPLGDGLAAAAVSSYAFHHLTDAEKSDAARELLRVVRPGGRVVVADIAYANEAARDELYRRLTVLENKQNLVSALQSEYYTTIDVLRESFMRAGAVSFEARRLTRYVWLIVAEKAGA